MEEVMSLFMPHAFDALLQFQRALDGFRESNWLDEGPSGSGAYPPLNVFRKGDDVVIVSEIPGIRKSDLRIEVKDSTVRIAGERSVNFGDRTSVHRRERSEGRFDRTVTLPVEIDPDRVKAEYRDGILALFLPQAETSKPRQINIA
jgi:HSP20 family protein